MSNDQSSNRLTELKQQMIALQEKQKAFEAKGDRDQAYALAVRLSEMEEEILLLTRRQLREGKRSEQQQREDLKRKLACETVEALQNEGRCSPWEAKLLEALLMDAPSDRVIRFDDHEGYEVTMDVWGAILNSYKQRPGWDSELRDIDDDYEDSHEVN